MNLKFSGSLIDKFQTILDSRHQIKNAMPEKKILILSTPRSGSTYFCNLLESSGNFGVPSEWLSPKVINDFNKSSMTKIKDIRQWYKLVQEKAVSKNKVFSIKLMIRQYAFWKNNGFNIPLEDFDIVIYVKRNNFLSQAISLAKCRITDVWDTTDKPKFNQNLDAIKISNSLLLKSMAEIAAWEEYFEKYLSHQVDKVCIYEEFSSNIQVFEEVFYLCKINNFSLSNLSSPTKIQRNEKDLKTLKEFSEWFAKKQFYI